MDIAKLSKCGKILNFKPDEIICMEKQEGETAYLILQGEAKVVLGSFNDANKKMAVLPAGVIFGEMSLLEGKPRSATVLAGDEGNTVLEIGKNDFIDLMKTDPELAYKLLRTMYKRMEDSMESHKNVLIAYNVETRRDAMYQQISKLSREQFEAIVSKDSEYALKLLKYLSHMISDIDRKVLEISK